MQYSRVHRVLWWRCVRRFQQLSGAMIFAVSANWTAAKPRTCTTTTVPPREFYVSSRAGCAFPLLPKSLCWKAFCWSFHSKSSNVFLVVQHLPSANITTFWINFCYWLYVLPLPSSLHTYLILLIIAAKSRKLTPRKDESTLSAKHSLRFFCGVAYSLHDPWKWLWCQLPKTSCAEVPSVNQ